MVDFFYSCVRRWLDKTVFIQYYRNRKATRALPIYSACNAKQRDRQDKLIIYLCPSTNIPQGGVKVIYKQVALINSLQGQLSANVLHPMSPNFNCKWFNNSAIFKRDLVFDPQNNFVIIPEFWAVPHARLIHNVGVRYGIYVQGGYIINRNNGEELDAAYHNAKLILAISDDTVECIKMAFPACADKVYRVHCSVNPDKFNARPHKKNIICYMPRRMKNHSELVTFFLNKKIPQHWKIESIDGLDEEGVAAILGRSKIFLSFSEMEGVGLPPVEAALSGCQVIGYTGEGGKEYWDNDIFTEIHSGDIKAFVKAVLQKIDEIDRSPSITHTAAIRNVADKFSVKLELADMHFVAQKVIGILSQDDCS